MHDVFLMVFAGCAALLLESMLIYLAGIMLKPKGRRRITIVTAAECGDLERRLRWMLFELDIDPFAADRTLLIVNNGMCGQDIEIARRLCCGRQRCRLCDISEIAAIVDDDAVCKAVELVLY